MWVRNTVSRTAPFAATLHFTIESARARRFAAHAAVAAALAAFAVGCGAQEELLQARTPMAPVVSRDVEAEPVVAESPRGRTRDELGNVTVSGGAVDDANQVAASMMPSFRRCKLKWSPKSSGEVHVAAKIGPVGEVRMATPEAADPMPPMLVACVRAKVASAKFAAPTGNDPTVVIPIRFQAD